MRKIVFVLFIVILLVIGGAAGTGYVYLNSALGPMDENNTEMIDVHIPIGSSSTRIGAILEENGLVKNGTFFRYYVRYKNETGFQAGDYQLSKSMDLDEIISELKDGTLMEDYEITFTIPEGRWLEHIITIIADNTAYSEEDIQEKMLDREYLESLVEKHEIIGEEILNENIRWPLEGYLFPARYDFVNADTELEEIIDKMIERTSQVYFKHRNDLDEENEFTTHEILTLASIIEREAQKSEDRYLISGVLYNRLDLNMLLQVDPTVAYAHGEHRYMTSFADLEIDSPYNTYRYPGIPIGPIASPGEDAIRAALNPADIDYLFFYARRNGEVLYNETFAEHDRVHQKYRDEWIQGQ